MGELTSEREPERAGKAADMLMMLQGVEIPKVSLFNTHKAFFKSFCKSEFHHESVNLFRTLVIVKDKLTDLRGSRLFQNDFEIPCCEISFFIIPHPKPRPSCVDTKSETLKDFRRTYSCCCRASRFTRYGGTSLIRTLPPHSHDHHMTLCIVLL